MFLPLFSSDIPFKEARNSQKEGAFAAYLYAIGSIVGWQSSAIVGNRPHFV